MNSEWQFDLSKPPVFLRYEAGVWPASGAALRRWCPEFATLGAQGESGLP